MEPLEENKNINWWFLAEFLKTNITKVKKSLGGDCSFLSFLEDKELVDGKYRSFTSFLAYMKNSTGGKDRVVIRLGKPSFELKAADFRDLAVNLGTRAYERGAIS